MNVKWHFGVSIIKRSFPKPISICSYKYKYNNYTFYMSNMQPKTLDTNIFFTFDTVYFQIRRIINATLHINKSESCSKYSQSISLKIIFKNEE